MENALNNLLWPLLGVVLIIGLAYWGTKWLSKHYNRLGSGKYMRVVERVAIGQDKWLLLVELAGKTYFLGVGPSGVNVLHILGEDQVFPLSDSGEAVHEFSGVMAEMIKKSGFYGGKKKQRRNEKDEEKDET